MTKTWAVIGCLAVHILAGKYFHTSCNVGHDLVTIVLNFALHNLPQPKSNIAWANGRFAIVDPGRLEES